MGKRDKYIKKKGGEERKAHSFPLGSSMESQDLVMMSTPLITPERPDESVAAVPEKGILKKVKVVAPSPSPSQKKKEQQKQTAKGGQEQKGNAKGKGKVVQETKKQQTGKEKTGEEKGKGKEQTEEKEAEDKDASLTPSRTRHRSRSHNPSPSPSTPVVQEEWEVVGQPQVQAVKAKVNEMEKVCFLLFPIAFFYPPFCLPFIFSFQLFFHFLLLFVNL